MAIKLSLVSADGSNGMSALNSKFKQYSKQIVIKAENGLKEMSGKVSFESKKNVRSENVIDSGELLGSHYVRKIGFLTYQTGISAPYAIFPEFGTGIYNMFGRGRTDGWHYFDISSGEWVFTYGQRPKLFFSDALEKVIPTFSEVMIKQLHKAVDRL
jgi:HK97 gp10 family phage protein